MKDLALHKSPWTLLQKTTFRFFFIYFLLAISPWTWFSIIPGVNYLLEFYYDALDWAVITSNENIFQVFGIKHVQFISNGSADTSYSWAFQWLSISLAAIGAFIWSVAGYRYSSHRQLNYLLCLLIRYSLVMTAFSYGLIKILGLQMPSPTESQLATPVGDLLPMRLSWLFIGYSTMYQAFSGVMEVMVALLLLYRRTAVLGVLLATAVFINVMMLNLSYDIPVKLNAINLVLQCFYLLASETPRLFTFFILNKPVSATPIYHKSFTKKWARVGRIILKAGVSIILCTMIFGTYKRYKSESKPIVTKPFQGGVYNVETFVVNKDTIAQITTDSLRWQELVIDANGSGSIKTADTLFRRRYGRGYFEYSSDISKRTITFKKNLQAPTVIAYFNYQQPDSRTIILRGSMLKDSLYVKLVKTNRHFQLAERQFHWLSEANR
ncbi:MAG: hypothetical protein K0S09_928 [Sphingobacteriaceae bacterium]|nr:hypothetical protein [Sphingobacteriaceae bacterium]